MKNLWLNARTLFVILAFAFAQNAPALTLAQELAAKAVVDVVAISGSTATVGAALFFHKQSVNKIKSNDPFIEHECDNALEVIEGVTPIITGLGYTQIALNSIAAAATATAIGFHLLARLYPYHYTLPELEGGSCQPLDEFGGIAHFVSLGAGLFTTAASLIDGALVSSMILSSNQAADLVVPLKCIWQPFALMFATNAVTFVANALSLKLFDIRVRAIFGPCSFPRPAVAIPR